MVPTSIIGLLVLTGLVVESVSGGQTCFLSPLYPHGPQTQDIEQIGDDDSFPFNLNFVVPFYGSSYSTVHPSTNGVLGLGQNIWNANPNAISGTKALLSSYWNDHDLFTHGKLYYRKVNLDAEPGITCLVQEDAAAAGISFTPTMIFIATWKYAAPYEGLEDGSNTTTHQIVLASNGSITVAIFNYGRIDWEYISSFFSSSHSAVQFDKGNSKDLVAFPISMTYEMANIADYSNIGHAGRIVVQVDGDIQLPTLEKLVCRSCSYDVTSGNVITYDGSQALSMNAPNTKYIFSKKHQASQADRRDKCKFMLRTVTNSSGLMSWFAVSAGLHPKNNWKYKRNFAFDRTGPHKVDIRGHGFKGSSPLQDFPFYETIDDSKQCLVLYVDTTPQGFVASSPMCQFLMSYEPNANNNALRIHLGSEYDDQTIGMCQNNNGVLADDDKTCKPNEKADDLSDIGENCSCSMGDSNAVCDEQIRW